MALVPLILDSRPPYLDGAPGHFSLLSVPVGTGTLLNIVVQRMIRAGATTVRVLPKFDAPPDYEASVLDGVPSGTTLVDSDLLTDIAHGYDASDLLLVFDPRNWPLDGLDVAGLLRESRDKRWAVHGVAVDSASEGAREFVHCDDGGNVRRIRRYYDQVTCSRIGAITYSLVPMASVDGLRLDSLTGLRTHLTKRGLLSRDFPVPTVLINLADERGLLTLNEQLTVASLSRPPDPGFSHRQGGVLVGANVRIHPSASIVPPVIIHDGVTIEEKATVLGPSVIGPNSTLRRGSLVAQSVLLGRSTLAPGAVLRQRVGAGRCEPFAGLEIGEIARVPSSTLPNSQSIQLGADSSLMRDVRSRRSIYPAFKLTIDIVAAAVSLVLLSPLLAIVAAVIKLDSRGPVFFGHEREGKGGKVFHCLKFRTMIQDAHKRQRELYSTNELDGPQFKLHNDPRVTRVGGLLRATNIDELPQFINVLFGQMSLIGPRPSPFRENQICVPWRRARLSVRPGITGLWQICRDQRSEGDFHQWIAYDIMYVRNLSFLLDARILLATVLTLGGMWRVPHNWIVRRDRERAGSSMPTTPHVSPPQSVIPGSPQPAVQH